MQICAAAMLLAANVDYLQATLYIRRLQSWENLWLKLVLGSHAYADLAVASLCTQRVFMAAKAVKLVDS